MSYDNAEELLRKVDSMTSAEYRYKQADAVIWISHQTKVQNKA
jgi:hypothetical protein